MTKTAKIQQAIIKDPNRPSEDIAKELFTTKGTVHKFRSLLRKEGKIPAADPDWRMKIKQQHPALAAECETVGIPIEQVNHGWYKGKFWSLHFKGEVVDFVTMRDELLKDISKYKPKYPSIKRQKQKDASLYIIDPCDPHFGKYGSKEEVSDDYSLNKAITRYSEGVDGLLSKGENSHKIEKIVIIGGNDVAHTDNPFRTTTQGTKQDTDGMWFEAFNAAKWCNIKAIENARLIAPVHFVHCPSNHDFMTGFFLAKVLEAWFRDCKDVTFDVTNRHRKYIQYGRNLIGATHSDGAPESELPKLMSVEAKQAWSLSDYSYWYLHHIHHKDKKIFINSKAQRVEKDGKGMCVISTGLNLEPKDKVHVEYVRSISGSDRWHSTKGFEHSFAAMEGFIHHPECGQISRLTHLF